MVKKIRVLDEPEEELVAEDVTKQAFEILKSLDWKIWELLQTVQRLEKKVQILESEDE